MQYYPPYLRRRDNIISSCEHAVFYAQIIVATHVSGSCSKDGDLLGGPGCPEPEARVCMTNT